MRRATPWPDAPLGRPAFTPPTGRGARKARPCSMTCCPRVSTRPGPAGRSRRDPCAPASVSASRAGHGDGGSRGLPPPGGPQVGPTLQGRLGPLASRRTCRTTTCVLSAARSGASRHLVVGLDVRSNRRTAPDGRRRRFVPPERRGPQPQSGQERPPRRRRYAAPALTPRGVAPALVATTATVPSRQTNRRTARGGLSTAMRPIVPSVFIARSRCLSDRSATEEMPQIV